MDIEEYRRIYGGRDATPGWDAINEEVDRVYGNQEPKHWGTLIKHMMGGPDPIDGISAYQCRESRIDHLHFVTYGYSSLYYDEESVGADYSKFGFEMTFRLKSDIPPSEEPIWACSLLQNIAKYVFQTGNYFDQYHWMPANGPIRGSYKTDLVGLIFVNDPVLNNLNTVHGRVDFLQAFGITNSELNAIMEKQKSPQEVIDYHRKTNPLLVTDLDRQDGE